MLLKCFLMSLISVCPVLMSAQYYFQDDPIKLKEVRVTSSRLNDYGVGATVSRPDSDLVKINRDEPLSSLLANSSSVSLKTYGAGGLSSVSIRGGISDHTAILWNGLNIQSPMNGGANLSVMPVRFFNHVEIQHGGLGTLFGSGAVSGVIHLSGNNLLKMENVLNASATAGSFGFGSAGADFKTGSDKFAARLSVFGQKSDNDFTFINTSRINHPEETQTNAGVEQYGILQENQGRISERSLVTTGFWYQDYDKDLQTLMTSRRPNDTNQKDENILASVNYKYYGQKGTLNLKQGLVRNKVLYSNPELANPQSDNNSFSWISEAEYKYRPGPYHSVNAGVNYTYELARSDGYMGDITRNRLAFFASGRYGLTGGLGAVVLSAREEITDNNFQPIVVSLGIEHRVWNSLSLKGNISKNYRIPDLNDLYWAEDGYAKGNPDLIAESGWSGDVGAGFSFRTGNIITELNSAFFASKTDDIIVWLPENGEKWMPHNMTTGSNVGAEASANMKASFGKSEIGTRLFYTYVKSTLSTSDEYNDQQMIYIPKHKFNAVFNISRNDIYATVAGGYTGERFYDHERTLDAYTLYDASMGYKLELYGVRVDAFIKVKNITNTQYQVVAWYAMPPRNYRITLNLTI